MAIDFLVVGQGLAGTLLAHQLLEQRFRISIIDRYDGGSSSYVAAGLFNPITGKRFVKTWNADRLFSFMHRFYPTLQQRLGEKFFHPCEIYRPFASIEEQNDWLGNSAKPEYKEFIKEIYRSPGFARVRNPLGGVLIREGGYIDMPVLLRSSRKYFEEKEVLINETFDDAALDIGEDSINYKGLHARKIIFARGVAEKYHSFFNWLPFRPVKGEILNLKLPVPIERIYNRGCFITPNDRGISRCGSTYDWRDQTLQPTKKGRDTIIANLQALIHSNAEVVDQQVGIRPATADRRPIVGFHPELKPLVLFNGLGAKGVTLAPFYAHQLVGVLQNSANLDDEVNIERYYSLYYKSISEKNNRGK